MDLGIALEGFFFEKVNGSTGQRVTDDAKSIRRMIADDTRLSSLRPHHRLLLDRPVYFLVFQNVNKKMGLS